MLPKAVNYDGKIYNTVGMIKMNNGAFLVSENENKLANFDFTRISSILSDIQFEIKKPTGVEVVLMTYIQNTIQEKIDSGKINNINELMKAFTDINRYVNTNESLLSNMRQLDGKDNIVDANMESLMDYFAESMSENQYFQNEKIEIPQDKIIEVEHLTPVVETKLNIEPTIQQVQQPIINHEPINLVEESNSTIKPVETVVKPTMSATNQVSPLDNFINNNLNSLTLEQIELLLTKQGITEVQRNKLNERKQFLSNSNSEKIEESISQQQGKRKRLSLLGSKEGENAAFVDTLLLSFTVGIFSGIYLMYFILTIMS